MIYMVSSNYFYLLSHLLAHSYMGSTIPIKYKGFLNRSNWLIVRTLTGTAALGQCGSGSKGNKRVTPSSVELEPYY